VPVTGLVVAFNAPASGASAVLTGSPFTVGVDGIASVTATANGTVGGYNVTASASGAASVNFALTNLPDCASNITVTNNADSGAGSLRQAIADVCAGGTITFDNDYTILLGNELAIGKNLSVDGGTHSVTVSGNHVTRVFKVTAGTVVFNHLTIADGNAADCTGSIFATCGGGLMLQNNGVNVTVTNSTFSGNSTENAGGGIYNAGTLTVTNCAFSGNSVEYGTGAGIFNGVALTATVTNSVFSDNIATFGGGISNNGYLTVTNSAFSDNRAIYGGGIYNANFPLTVTNSTFSGNSATDGGGIYNSIGGTLHLNNNLLANATSGGDCYNTGTIGANINNLIETNGPGANACGTPSLTGDPLLSALGDYGGSTRTFALLPGSPAIDAGDRATCAAATVNSLDQRGVTRPSACDIGAFESQGFTLTKTGGDNQSTLVNTDFGAPLTLSVASAFGEPVNDGQVTFTVPASGASASIISSPGTISSGVVSVDASANGIVGGYNVTASASGANSADFALRNLGTPVITWANPSNIVYGTPLGATQLNATANVPGTFAYTPDTGEVLDVGTHTLHVDFVPTDAVNYTNTSKDVSITVMESTAPFVLSITRVDPNPTELDSLRFTVTFSESVTGVDEGDFILTATGKIDGEAIISVDGSGDTYTVTVSRGTGGGTLRLDVPDSAIITDQVGNSLTTPYESGEAYTILFKIYLPLYAHDTNVFLAPYKGPNP
jgi:hypothetical protein